MSGGARAGASGRTWVQECGVAAFLVALVHKAPGQSVVQRVPDLGVDLRNGLCIRSHHDAVFGQHRDQPLEVQPRRGLLQILSYAVYFPLKVVAREVLRPYGDDAHE